MKRIKRIKLPCCDECTAHYKCNQARCVNHCIDAYNDAHKFWTNFKPLKHVQFAEEMLFDEVQYERYDYKRNN